MILLGINHDNGCNYIRHKAEYEIAMTINWMKNLSIKINKNKPVNEHTSK